MGAGHSHPLHVHGHSPVHRLAPEAKVVGAFGFVFTVALAPREAIWAFAIFAAMLAAVRWRGEVPAKFLIARLALVLPFIAFAFIVPFISSGEQVDVLGVGVSREGLWSSWNILAKALIGATTSILLAATTELPALLRGLERLKVPRVFTAITAFMVRYLEVVTGELGRMRVAMISRGHDARWLWQAKPIAQQAGSLFVRSYERGERVHAAMLARGFTGVMPELDDRRATSTEWRLVAVWLGLAIAVTSTAWILR